MKIFKLLCWKTRLSKSSVEPATKWLHVNLTDEADCVARVQLYYWLCVALCSGEVDPFLRYFPDEELFY
jgi:hypothetical protein